MNQDLVKIAERYFPVRMAPGLSSFDHETGTKFSGEPFDANASAREKAVEMAQGVIEECCHAMCSICAGRDGGWESRPVPKYGYFVHRHTTKAETFPCRASNIRNKFGLAEICREAAKEESQ